MRGKLKGYPSGFILVLILSLGLNACVSSQSGIDTDAPNPGSSEKPGSTPTPSPDPAPSESPLPLPSPEPSAPPSPAPSSRPSSAANETVCASSAVLKGVDVYDQDVGTNWPTLKRSGQGFAYIKATEGLNFRNPEFPTDWDASLAAGIVRGAYHYFHPLDDPDQQAQYFLSAQGKLEPGDLPPMLDWETTDGTSVSTAVSKAKAWLDEVQAATGKTPVIYVDPSFFNSLGNPTEFAAYPLFIANYEVTCPSVPPPWSNWAFWQQGTGTLIGIQNTEADLDVFNGTQAQLDLFANTGIF